MAVDPKSGYCAATGTFLSIRPRVPLPSENLPLSITSFAFSLLPSPLPTYPALINASTSESVSYSDLVSKVRSLSYSLKTKFNLLKGDIALIISPSSVYMPLLYLALLDIGVVLCPVNPLSTHTEISYRCGLVSTVSVVFASISSTVSKVPQDLTANVILLDSPQFCSLLVDNGADSMIPCVQQRDKAVIEFSSGTTGEVKAVALSHRSFIVNVATHYHLWRPAVPPEIALLMSPMFHSHGLMLSLKGPALAETLVISERTGFVEMLSVIERCKVTVVATAPPIVVMMARGEEINKFELGSLKMVLAGGAPLSADASIRFAARFPHILLRLGYGSTEAGGIARMNDKDECDHFRSVGRLSPHLEAKIIDVVTGKALSINEQGELWLRGPAIMTGYVSDDVANALSLDSEGWLKTGDLCYFDNDGFLYVVDRLKDMIKYKAYQVTPAELEHLLHSIPDIVDAAVVPYPQEEVGQIPVAFVVKQQGSGLSEDQIMDYVAKKVTPYKKIRKVIFINAMPKSATGKVLKRELASHAKFTSKL